MNRITNDRRDQRDHNVHTEIVIDKSESTNRNAKSPPEDGCDNVNTY